MKNAPVVLICQMTSIYYWSYHQYDTLV